MWQHSYKQTHDTRIPMCIAHSQVITCPGHLLPDLTGLEQYHGEHFCLGNGHFIYKVVILMLTLCPNYVCWAWCLYRDYNIADKFGNFIYVKYFIIIKHSVPI